MLNRGYMKLCVTTSTSVICMFIAGSGFGQTLTCQTSCPQPGEVFSMRTSSPAFSSPGPNQVWNFSNIPAISPGTHLISYSPASSVPAASLYPQAGLVRTNTNWGVDFLLADSSGVQKASAVTVTVNVQPVELPLPFAYGDTFTQNVISTSVTGTDTFVTTWYNSFSGHGSGTLILPSGTYPDVLAVKLYSTWSTKKNGSTYGYTYYKTAYYYYSQNISHPLIYSMWLSESGPNDYIPYTEFIDRVVTGAEGDAIEGINTLEVYPNPADDLVNVGYAAMGRSIISLTDAMGRLLIEQVVSEGECSLKLRDLPVGIYFITLAGEESVVYRKLIVGRSH